MNYMSEILRGVHHLTGHQHHRVSASQAGYSRSTNALRTGSTSYPRLNHSLKLQMSCTGTTVIFWRFVMMYWTMSSMFGAVNSCRVHPTAVLVATGERVSLSCLTSANTFVSSWQNGADVSKKTVVYTAPVYNRDGTIRKREFIAGGYSVDKRAENQVILHINNISLSQAGVYYCSNTRLNTASSAVVVLKPEFSVNSSARSMQPVSLICNILSSEDISYVLTIKDETGNTVARKNGSSLCNSLTNCSLQHTVIANTSVNESYSCTVNVTTNRNNNSFLKVLNASIDWDNRDPTGTGEASSSKNEWNYNWITALTACGGVIAFIAVAVASVLLYRNRRSVIKCKRSSHSGTKDDKSLRF